MLDESQQSALQEIFLRHKGKLRGIAKSIVKTTDLTDEVMQDAYLKVADAPQETTIRQPLCYCGQVVRNLALDCYRRHSIEATYRTFVEDVELLPVAAIDWVPERLIEARQSLAMIDQILNKLAPRTRQAFELSRLGGMTQREIGAHMGCSATLVNVMIKEADSALQSCRHLLPDSN